MNLLPNDISAVARGTRTHLHVNIIEYRYLYSTGRVTRLRQKGTFPFPANTRPSKGYIYFFSHYPFPRQISSQMFSVRVFLYNILVENTELVLVW